MSKTDKIRFAHYRLWRQIDIIGYLNGSTSSKFVSASFKSFIFGAECISMWPLCSYCINLNVKCWCIKKLSSKYNTLIWWPIFPFVPQDKFEFLSAEGCACLILRRIRVFIFAGTKREKPEPKSGTKTVEVYDTDRYQCKSGHHWWSMVVSAAEGRGPNARVDSAPCLRGAASTIEHLKWFREFSRQNAEYSFVLSWLVVHWSICKFLEPKSI